jgi:hypothetical protein
MHWLFLVFKEIHQTTLVGKNRNEKKRNTLGNDKRIGYDFNQV